MDVNFHLKPGRKRHNPSRSLASRSKKVEMGEKHPILDDPALDDIVESDVELDDSDVVEADDDPPVEMGDPTVDVTVENQESAQRLKLRAMNAVLVGKLDKAIEHLTNAIKLNPRSAVLLASRAIVFVKLKKPNAAIRDAGAALQINPDLAKGYKARGMARALLGLWEEADTDLDMVLELDFDEEAGDISRKVKQNAVKIYLHHEKYKRIRLQKEMKLLEGRLKEGEITGTLRGGRVIRIRNEDDFAAKLEAALELSRLVVLYFTAAWCGPCRYIGPACRKMAVKFQTVVFLKVDIDYAKEVAAEWNISSIPTFYLWKGGDTVSEVTDCNMYLLENKIAEFIASSSRV